jgi:hypothetical protein
MKDFRHFDEMNHCNFIRQLKHVNIAHPPLIENAFIAT